VRGLSAKSKNFGRRFFRDIKLQAAIAESGIGGCSIPHQRLPSDPLKKK